MNARLKRIEATLQNLGDTEIKTVSEVTRTQKESFSFTIEPSASTEADVNRDSSIPPEEFVESNPENMFFENHGVQAFSANKDDFPMPNLPKFKTPNFTSHRNSANPALATNILQEIQQIAGSWQTELQKIVRQIQDIYLQGPIINGWLESDVKEKPQSQNTEGKAKLRHAEVEQLMDYVEKICAAQKEALNKAPRAGYRLCGLDSSGKVWSRPCPSEQVASVSMGIARYHKLRQMLGRKQYLENRLNQLAQTLVVLHGHIKSEE